MAHLRVKELLADARGVELADLRLQLNEANAWLTRKWVGPRRF